MDEKFPDFSGKSVIFYVKSVPDAMGWISEGLVLESPVFQKFGNRIFVTGTTPEAFENEDDKWAAEREAGLDWDSVLYYLAMPSEDYRVVREQEQSENK